MVETENRFSSFLFEQTLEAAVGAAKKNDEIFGHNRIASARLQ